MKLLNPEVRIENTNLCNSNCVMCPREKLTRPLGVMEWGLFKKIIDDAKGCGIKHVFLGGFGEPMQDAYFIKRIKYIKHNGLTVNTITTASFLNPKMSDEIIESGLDSIRISFYGLTKEVYESIHRGLSFDAAVRNIKELIAKRNNKNKPTLEISLSFLILKENSHQVSEFDKFWVDADFVEIWRPHNFINGRNYRDRATELKSCGRPWRGPLQIQWDGTVVPCCFDYNGYLILGDLKKQSIEELMHDELYEKLRNAHKKENLAKFKYCSMCDQLDSGYNALVFSNDARRAQGRSNSNFFDFTEK